MASEGSDESLQHLARRINRSALRVPVTMALDALRPVDFLSSQAALFARPFVRGTGWDAYTFALTHEANWTTLRTLLRQQADQQDDEQEHPTG